MTSQIAQWLYFGCICNNLNNVGLIIDYLTLLQSTMIII